MECIVPAKTMKLFSKVIQCLAKISDDLWIEAFTDKFLEL